MDMEVTTNGLIGHKEERYTWRLWCSYAAALFGLSFSVGFSVTNLNLLENHVNCWLFYADVSTNQTVDYYELCRNATTLAKAGHFETYRMQWSLLSSAMFIGGIVGNMLASLADLFGRQKVILACLLTQGGSTILQLIAINQFNFWIFAAGRAIGGLAFGAAQVIVPMYTMEITPLQHQASVGTLHSLGYNTGGVIVIIVASTWVLGKVDLWFYVIGMSGITAVVGLIIYPFTVESPSYLLRAGKTQKSEKAQMLLHDAVTFRAEENSKPRQKGYVSSLRHLFRHKDYRKLLLIVTVMRSFFVAGGVFIVMVYTLGIAQSVNLGPEEASIFTILNQVLNCVAGLCAPVMMSKFGMKRAFQMSFLAMVVALSSAFMLGFSASSSYYTAVTMCAMLVMSTVAAMAGVIPIGYSVAVLWIPTELRGFVMSAVSVLAMGLMFVTALLFPSSLAYLGHYTYLIMAIVTVVGGGISWWYMFDSAGMTPDEILEYITKRKA